MALDWGTQCLDRPSGLSGQLHCWASQSHRNVPSDCAHRYAGFDHIFVAQDNWSIHKHPDVVEALHSLPQIEPVWLPTYAPWLNPIEKLWRWLRQDVLKMHRLAAHWSVLRQKVNAFLDQFAAGSQALLRYVGLAGDAKLAQAIRLT